MSNDGNGLIKKNNQSDEKNTVKNLNGIVAVRGGKIIVENPIGAGGYAKVIPIGEGELRINGKKVTEGSIVKEEDEIIFGKESVTGKRCININVNDDNTEARINISYETGLKYEIKNKPKDNVIKLELNELEDELPPLFTSKDIIDYLDKNGISIGVKREEIKKVESNRYIKDLCVAVSRPLEETVQDTVKIIYNPNKWNNNQESMENIDYKNIISIQSVKKGDVIAEIIKGRTGKEGLSIYNKKIKASPYKEIRFKIGSGCKLEGNKVIATIDGKPSVKNNMFSVSELHTINGDVDIKSRNVIFTGDIWVTGKVTEGMSIISKSVNIEGGSFKASIKVNDTSLIKGNIVNSEIKIGGQDLLKQKKMQELVLLKEQLNTLLESLNFLKEKKLIDENIADGNLIKTLIESKYQTIPKHCAVIIGLELSSIDPNKKLISILKEKLIGRGPISINKYLEIEDIINRLNKEIELIEFENSLSSDLTMEYCQESNIEVLGNVLVIGKGSYTSKIFAMENIEFTESNSVCRGGHLKSSKLIKLGTVGSHVGVETKLEVSKDGHIYVDRAYQNTVFVVGKCKYILSKHSRDIHAYMGRKGELIVDKLYL